MPQYGYIRDKMDVNVLILYLTARMAAPVDFPTLTDLSMCDEGVNYFLFAQAVSELVESEHLVQKDEQYSITEKGRKNGAAWEESLPPSIRRKCDRNLVSLNIRLRREAQIRAEISPRSNSKGFTVRFILDDNDGNLMTTELYSPTEEQAAKMAETFRKFPDRVYRAIIDSLQDPTDINN